MGGVLAAVFRATAADSGKIAVAQLIARLRTGLTNLRASGAGDPVLV